MATDTSMRDAILAGIRAARMSPDCVARADAAICRAIGREVDRAVRIVNTYGMWKTSGPATADERLAAARETDRWSGLASDAEVTIAAAIAGTSSFEAAADAIEAAGALAS